MKKKSQVLRKRVKSAEVMLKYMKEKIQRSTQKLGVDIDYSLHDGLGSIMAEHSEVVHEKYAPGTFHHLFWEQQVKTMATTPKQRRWHPMLIRWCLHLKMLSSAAYNELRGILKLPCGRTLQDYTRWVKADRGVQPEVTEQLVKESKCESLHEWQKYIAVVFDEVKIKEGIVYDKHECNIVGFVDFGDINSALLSFEANTSPKFPVAKHMLVFMVRGLFFKLNFPYAQFPTLDLSADLLYPMVLGGCPESRMCRIQSNFIDWR